MAHGPSGAFGRRAGFLEDPSQGSAPLLSLPAAPPCSTPRLPASSGQRQAQQRVCVLTSQSRWSGAIRPRLRQVRTELHKGALLSSKTRRMCRTAKCVLAPHASCATTAGGCSPFTAWLRRANGLPASPLAATLRARLLSSSLGKKAHGQGFP